MKKLFIEARKKVFPEIGKKLDGIRGKIHIIYSIQFKELAEQARKELGKREDVEIMGFGQVLGCSKVRSKADWLLLCGEGRFHALNIAVESGKEVKIFDGNNIHSIGKEEIQRERKKLDGKKARFLLEKKVGLIVSVKPGQNQLEKAMIFKKKAEKRWKDKEFYAFLCDSLNFSELENFDIDIWVNFACPGIQFDNSKIINYSAIEELLA